WADIASLRLLKFCARELRASRVLLVGTFRDAEARASAAVTEPLLDVVREGRIIHLGGLAEAEVADLIAATSGIAPSGGLASLIHRATEGNPFFVEAITRLLVSDGRLEQAHAFSLDTLRIPDEVREPIRQLLRRLSPDAQRLIRLAAVIGREFDRPLLEAASRLDRGSVLDALAEAKTAAILVEISAPLGLYRFAHDLIAQTLYDDLPPSERVEHHRRIAEVLEETFAGGSATRLAELGRHYFEAIPTGTIDKAIDYAMRAGKHALATFAWEEAVREFERARLALEMRSADDSRRLDLLLDLGDALRRAGDLKKSRHVLQQAAELAEATGAAGDLARAALAVSGEPSGTGRYDDLAVHFLERALASIGTEDSILRARLLARLGRKLLFSNDYQRRQAVCREAVDLARRLGDPATLAYALVQRHQVQVGSDAPLSERLSGSEEIVRLAKELGDTILLARGYMARLADLLESGEIATFESELERYAQLAQRIHHPWHAWSATVSRATLSLLKGAFGEAERLAEEALALGQSIREAAATPAYGNLRFGLRVQRGSFAELEPIVRAQVARFPRVAGWRICLALILGDGGKEGEARIELERLAANDFAEVPRDHFWAMCICILCEICALLGDTGRAERLYELLAPYEGRNAVAGFAAMCWGSIDRFLGLAAAATARWEPAARHFERALDFNRRMGFTVCLAETRLDYGRMLLARGAPGDREKGLELLDEALRTARELGMKRVEGKAEALKADATRRAGSEAPRRPARNGATPGEAILRKEGDFWTIGPEGAVF
ncbi:MAG: ATP-binding protein, partial [Candidatus Binatia bacterium]